MLKHWLPCLPFWTARWATRRAQRANNRRAASPCHGMAGPVARWIERDIAVSGDVRSGLRKAASDLLWLALQLEAGGSDG